MHTNWYCNLCHQPIVQQLGQWFHRWSDDDKLCAGPDKPVHRDNLPVRKRG